MIRFKDVPKLPLNILVWVLLLSVEVFLVIVIFWLYIRKQT